MSRPVSLLRRAPSCCPSFSPPPSAPLQPATTPAAFNPKDFPALRRQLASSDFAQRQAAQKILDALPVSSLDTLRSLSKDESDPEVKARLDNRIDALELHVLTHPKGLSLHLHNANIQTLIDELSKQVGPDVQITQIGLANDSFSVDADDLPFWQVFTDLNRQKPLAVSASSTISTGAARVQLRLTAAPANRPPAYQLADSFLVTPVISGSPATGAWSLRLTINADPRLRITQYQSQLRIAKITDQNNASLVPALISSSTTTLSNLARPVPSCSASASFNPAPDAQSIKDLRASLDLAILEKETLISIDLTQPLVPLETSRGTLTVSTNGNTLTLSITPSAKPAPAPLPDPLAGSVANPIHYTTIRVLDADGNTIANSLTASTIVNLGLPNNPNNNVPAKVEISWPETSRLFSLPIELHDLPLSVPAGRALNPVPVNPRPLPTERELILPN